MALLGGFGTETMYLYDNLEDLEVDLNGTTSNTHYK